MKNLKLLIVANNTWASWMDKAQTIKAAFSPHVDLTITVQRSNFDVIPFIDYGEGKVGVEHDFYNKNITVRANGYDIVLFAVPLSQWRSQKHRGYRTDRDAGPVELQVGGDEN